MQRHPARLIRRRVLGFFALYTFHFHTYWMQRAKMEKFAEFFWEKFQLSSVIQKFIP